eukprot:4507926-Alexandrium_andersonii.AAC.1
MACRALLCTGVPNCTNRLPPSFAEFEISSLSMLNGKKTLGMLSEETATRAAPPGKGPVWDGGR